jgi:hypothetical protein
MEVDCKPAIGTAPICPKLSLLFHILTREKRGDTIGAAGALLAVQAMAQSLQDRQRS